MNQIEIKMEASLETTNQGVSTNVDLIERPFIKSYAGESPEEADETKRKAFFAHKCHFFVFTLAGKPVFTRLYDSENEWLDMGKRSA